MKKSNAAMLGLGISAALGVPAYFVITSMNNMAAELQIVRAEAMEATRQKEEAILQAEKDAKVAQEKAEAELLEQQREIARKIAAEQAQEDLKRNTAAAWDQFLAVLQDLDVAMNQSDADLAQMAFIVESGVDSIPVGNADPEIVPVMQFVKNIFKDANQRTIAYNADVRELANDIPGANLSAGVDGCSVVTNTLDSDNFLLNALGCAGGLLAGAGISNSNAESAAKALDLAYEEDMEAIINRFSAAGEKMDSTADYLMAEYGIETPDDYVAD